MYRKSYCTSIGVDVGDDAVVSKMLWFYVKFFYVIGKALLGELSCKWTGLLLWIEVSQ